MNEKIISWFEDLIPEIKKSGNVKEVFLKFANEKNLAPALLEKLGQVYNTAKTVNYLDKSAAKRGSSFEILDVSDMLETYNKEAKSDYSQNDIESVSSGRVPKDLFGGMTKDISLESSFDEQEIKLASTIKSKYKKESRNKRNQETLSQLVFDLKEDIRDLADDFKSEIQKKASLFSDVERDAIYYFEGAAKEACESLASYLESKHLHVKRASDAGEKRIVKDYKALNIVGRVQCKIDELEVAKKAEFQEQCLAKLTDEEKSIKSAGAPPTIVVSPKIKVDAPKIPDNTSALISMADSGGGGGSSDKKKGLVGGILGGVKGTDSAIGSIIGGEGVQNAMPNAQKGVEAFIADLADKGNKEQKDYDLGVRDVEQAAILQNLLSTDDILSEEDPEKVIDAYNTFRKLAPELASDINITRVTLRSMVQHEGLSVFDANQFSQAELDKSKVDNNMRAQEQATYGSKAERDDVQKKLAV
tara:strand:- start:385 stop:1806 length:1422 start_codon:yes stop_codon:yes gene_type:complete